MQLRIFGRISKIIQGPGWEGKTGSPPSPDTYPHPLRRSGVPFHLKIKKVVFL
jgi:hypothetical protein